MIVQAKHEFFHRNYAGAIILIALLFGGTTKQGIWSDDLINLLMLPAVVIGFTNLLNNRLGNAARGLFVCMFLFVLIQFLPIHIDRNLPELNDVSKAFTMWSVAPSRSFNAAISALSIMGFFLYLTTLRMELLGLLIRVIFIGVAINTIITTVQLSYSSNIVISGLLPYTIRMGLFENENHFSALSYLVIPLLAWYFLRKSWSPIIYSLIGGVLVGLQFAVGARAGMGLSAGLFVFCFLWAVTYDRSFVTKIIAYGFGVGLITFILLTQDISGLLDDDLREIYFTKSWEIAKTYWLTGTGLGSFFSIWPIFETKEILGEQYTTHVHNDHIELFLELGIWYFIMLFVFVVLILKNAFMNDLTQAVAISIFAILMHSLVDYPLRSTAISTAFTLLVAIVLSYDSSQHDLGSAAKKSGKVRERRRPTGRGPQPMISPN